METSSIHDLVDRLCKAGNDQDQRECAAKIKEGINSLQRSVLSLEGQLKDFYDAQLQHRANLEDYHRMVVSLNDQVKSYLDERV